jgi:hypothetical protein
MRLILCVLTVVLTSGCVANPQRLQTVALLDNLVGARSMLAEQPPRANPACTMFGDVQTRLYGEPGLSNVQPAWSALRDAATALNAVCDQNTLLKQPSNGSVALLDGRTRWQLGIQREMNVACDHLREAAVALQQQPPC